MNKNDILEKYSKPEDKLLVSRVIEKIENVKHRNLVQMTDFLDMYQINLLESLMKVLKEENYIFYGGTEEVERKILVIFPEKLKQIDKIESTNEYIKAIEIQLPKSLYEEYTHKIYLGAIMKLGIKREKIGDIIVDKTGADILVKPDILEYLLINLPQLTRFSKADIRQKSVEDLKEIDIKMEIEQITVTSLRLDSIISELLHTSRTKANEVILEERVFLNFKNEIKLSKEVQIGDKITIRGKGRFEILGEVRKTKNKRFVLEISKYA